MTRKFGILLTSVLTSAALSLTALSVHAQVNEPPIVTDSRIKTFVYSENEVFKLVMHYGFQSHIVFDKHELIQTVSVGDSYAWKITPVENRIFVKPLEESAYTNMTVVTDKRTYQFDLVSKAPGENLEDGLVYMVRFFYPAGNFDVPNLASNGAAGGGVPGFAPPQPSPNFSAFPGSPPQEPVPSILGTPPVPPSSLADTEGQLPASFAASPYNFDYTLTGPDSVAPQRVFDDGQKTYFEFPSGAAVPSISRADGANEVSLEYMKRGGFVVVNGVAKKFSLRSGKDTVYVFNEKI